MLTPLDLAERVVSSLEERGSDDIHALMNTVMDPNGEEAEVELYRQCLELVIDRGWGDLKLQYLHPRKRIDLDAAELFASFGEWFRYDAKKRFWMLGKGDPLTDLYPVLALTKRGFEKANELLGQRGYQWWK